MEAQRAQSYTEKYSVNLHVLRASVVMYSIFQLFPFSKKYDAQGMYHDLKIESKRNVFDI
jgi:hypothetical protein